MSHTPVDLNGYKGRPFKMNAAATRTDSTRKRFTAPPPEERRPLTPEEQADTDGLQGLWGRIEQVRKLTDAGMSDFLRESHGIKLGRVTIGQYRRGEIPLNTHVIMCFSLYLDALPQHFIPSWKFDSITGGRFKGKPSNWRLNAAWLALPEQARFAIGLLFDDFDRLTKLAAQSAPIPATVGVTAKTVITLPKKR